MMVGAPIVRVPEGASGPVCKPPDLLRREAKEGPRALVWGHINFRTGVPPCRRTRLTGIKAGKNVERCSSLPEDTPA